MWRVVVSGTRTAASGQWPVASEIEEAETTVIEKRRNKPNLPVVLTIGRLSLRTNRGGIEQEKRTQFPAGGMGREAWGRENMCQGNVGGKPRFPGASKIGVGRADWFRPLPPPNRAGGFPAHGSPVSGLV